MTSKRLRAGGKFEFGRNNTNQAPFTYDALNKLTKVTYPNTSTVTYSYDPNSNRLTMVDPSSSSYYKYDARNRLTNETKLISSAKYTTLYTYDKASNVVSIKYPDSFLLSLTYDAVNRVKKVGSFATVAYTVDDKMQTITFGSGEVATYTYDNRDRPTRILDKIGSTKNLDLNYTYDGTGNVLTLNTESYGYDWLDRLTSSSGPWTAITYTYDQVGNRVKMVQGSGLYNYLHLRVVQPALERGVHDIHLRRKRQRDHQERRLLLGPHLRLQQQADEGLPRRVDRPPERL